MTRWSLLFIAPFVLACRTTCDVDGDPSPAELAKEKKAALRAQPVCRELLRPRVTLGKDAIAVSTTKSVTVARDPGLLAERLKKYRDHFHAVWPADPWDGFAYVVVDEAKDARSFVLAVARAGYPAMRITAGAASADVVLVKDPGPRRLTVDARDGRITIVDPSGVAHDAASPSDVPAAVAAACARPGRCADLVVFRSDTLDEPHVRVLARVLASPPLATDKPPVDLAP